jgi:hypothetical protein
MFSKYVALVEKALHYVQLQGSIYESVSVLELE